MKDLVKYSDSEEVKSVLTDENFALTKKAVMSAGIATRANAEEIAKVYESYIAKMSNWIRIIEKCNCDDNKLHKHCFQELRGASFYDKTDEISLEERNALLALAPENIEDFYVSSGSGSIEE